MKPEIQRTHLATILAPKQQSLDFVRSKLWEQLPRSDQQACREAIARLLCQILPSTQENDEHE